MVVVLKNCIEFLLLERLLLLNTMVLLYRFVPGSFVLRWQQNCELLLCTAVSSSQNNRLNVAKQNAHDYDELFVISIL